MLETDWRAWPFGVWLLYALGAIHLAAFFAYYARFERLERAARAGGEAAVRRFNRSLRGFPNSFYAKMLGKRPLEPSTPETPVESQGNPSN